MDERRWSYLQATTNRGLRRTPVHRQVLTSVREGRIEWRAGLGPHGGFAPVRGARIPPGDELVALYELRDAGLIAVDRDNGRVQVTAAGLARLLQWGATSGRRAG